MSSTAELAELVLNGDIVREHTYLNTAAEGLPLKTCGEAVQRYLSDKARGEPGRVEMWQAHRNTGQLAAELFSVDASQIALMSSTTESLNWIADGLDWREGDEVIFTSVEFPSNLFPWVELTERGVKTRIVPPRDGLVRVEELLELLTPRTRLITASQVSYATGQHLDLSPIWNAVKDTPTLLCVDATQAAGRVEVRGDQADFTIASTFKWLNGIHGGAIMSVSSRAIDAGIAGPAGWLSAESCYSDDRFEQFTPQPDARRFLSGMPNFATVYALEQALLFNTAAVVKQRPVELQPLVDQLWEEINQMDVELLTPSSANDRAGIVAFVREDAEDIKAALGERKIHVHADDGRVRATAHWYNTEDDISRYLGALKEIL